MKFIKSFVELQKSTYSGDQTYGYVYLFFYFSLEEAVSLQNPSIQPVSFDLIHILWAFQPVPTNPHLCWLRLRQAPQRHLLFQSSCFTDASMVLRATLNIILTSLSMSPTNTQFWFQSTQIRLPQELLLVLLVFILAFSSLWLSLCLYTPAIRKLK